MNGIALFGSTYGIAAPILLLGIPLSLGLLVYAYLRKGRSKEVIVSSLLLLKSLKKIRPARKNFVPPLRFFLELLILALLTLAASGAYKSGVGQRVVVLIDNSPSMLAIDSNDPTGRSILEEALTEARSFLTNLPSETKTEIFVTSPDLHPLSAAPASPANSISTLSRVEVSYSADHLDHGLASLSLQSSYDTIAVFTDKLAATSNTGQSSDRRIIFHPIGDIKLGYNNVAVSAISQQTNPVSGKAAIKVRIDAHTNEAVDLSGELWAIQNAEHNFEDRKSTRLNSSHRL